MTPINADLGQVRWLHFRDIADARGRLTALEGEREIPFAIERVFYVHKVAAGQDRGGHAHLDTDQVIIGAHGSLKIELSDGLSTKTFVLDDPGRGVYQPRMVWIRMCDFSPDALCLVLSSTKYDPTASFRTWEDYLVGRGIPVRAAD
jgi:hypothetical protein